MNIFCETVEVPFDSFTFPGGEEHIRLKPVQPEAYGDWHICAQLISSSAIMKLLLAVDAIRRINARARIELTIPYLPYARQDRVAVDGEALSLKVMCDLLNSQGFHRVNVWDVHSAVATALLDRARSKYAHAFACRCISPGMVLVAPDAGAIKRVEQCAFQGQNPIVQALKQRDPATGRISGVKVYSDHIGDRDFMIVDDICDGGATFTMLAMSLRHLTRGRILLYVTHGIFSKGLEPFEGVIDHIYCANIWPSVKCDGFNITNLDEDYKR